MNYIKQIKEFLKDPKKKSLTQLGLYLIFFLFVFILLSNASYVEDYEHLIEESKTSIETFESAKSYTYKVTLTSLDKIDIIEGTYYDNKSLLNYNNLKYYYEDSLYIIDNDSYYLANIEYNISKIFSKNLYNLFNDLEEESKTTYKDGTIVINYKIDSNKVYNYLFDSESTYDNFVNINIKEQDNLITNIVFDLTNLGLNLNKIEIEYSNINNIESLEFNKDNYIYKESLW